VDRCSLKIAELARSGVILSRRWRRFIRSGLLEK
jgi:hypothetical protein